ncbi:hypothetical protein [Clostridium beijerinckii]|uniref:Uncharacterized protein n=1 Tax=Clostridium beijerinckii TaxID=1520 RepID=A0AAX0BB59_CLOBE|nr:hypothetical protein [Clostridium beijerinckii]NRT92347.1 hypothetical protein [Clostridium beijerinckii]NYC75510.1 hypothetical protein [Clostridium beijerinckii]
MVWTISRNSATYNGETQHLLNITTPDDSPNAATSFNLSINRFTKKSKRLHREV